MAEHESGAIGSLAPGHYGATGSGVTLCPLTVASAWNIQGDLQRPAFSATVQQLFGIGLPARPNTTARSGNVAAWWLGPASWLLVAERDSALDRYDDRRDALNAQGGALFDLTASRVAWRIAGPHAAAVLSKGCPLDLDARVFAAGSCAQSVMGHVNALVRRDEAESSFTVMVARSYARDAWQFLCASAAQYGYEVLPPAPFG